MGATAKPNHSVGELAAKPVLSFADVCLLVGLPMSTMSKLDKEGKGPKWFFLGRRKFVRRASFDSWIQQREGDASAVQLNAGEVPNSKPGGAE
jgi:predicted DNA-binding transcriptional regulator AlpA